MITIKPIPALRDNYIWAIVDEKSKKTVIVDPGEAAPVIHFLTTNSLSLMAILLTHHHWDHINGVAALEPYCNVVIGPAKDNVASLTSAVDQGDNVNIAGFPIIFNVMSIPGHTNGHIAFYANGMLFCGDTLFAAGCGRAFEGTPETLYASLQKMAQLPSDTPIYCGHEYTQNNLRFAEQVEPRNQAIKTRIKEVEKRRSMNLPTLPSTLALEKETNPFLRCQEKDVIASASSYAKKTLTTPEQVFKHLRQWKNEF